MKRSLCFVGLFFLAGCGGAGGSMSNTPSSASVTASLAAIDTAPSASFDSMLNNVRSVNGAAPVVYDSRLGIAAQRHADDMLAGGFLEHEGSDNSTVGTRVTDAGYIWQRVGENIAQGHVDEEAVLRGWVNSSGHQENNIHPHFEDFALAKAGSGSQQYWVLVLATEL